MLMWTTNAGSNTELNCSVHSSAGLNTVHLTAFPRTPAVDPIVMDFVLRPILHL